MTALRDIPGYEGLYAVASDGRIWRHPRTWSSGRNRSLQRSVSGAWLSPSMRGRYLAVCLTKDGREKTHNVHRLVALTWISNPEGFPQVNHLDGDKRNNAAANLEWTTAAGNARHAWRTGLKHVTPRLRARGKELSRIYSGQFAKLTADQREEIARRATAGESQRALAAEFGVAQSRVCQIRRAITPAAATPTKPEGEA